MNSIIEVDSLYILLFFIFSYILPYFILEKTFSVFYAISSHIVFTTLLCAIARTYPFPF